MNGVHPTVRYLIPCENVRVDPTGQQVSLDNIVSVLRAPEVPMRQRELCVFVQMVECRGTGNVAVRIEEADSADIVFQTATRAVAFGTNPLMIKGLSFRIRNCLFATVGLYLIQFLYNDEVIAEQPLLVG